jgi:hypothetical protein
MYNCLSCRIFALTTVFRAPSGSGAVCVRVKSRISVRGGGRQSVKSVIPYFHITPFLARRGCNIVYFNPMAHGTENATKSVHYPVMYLCSLRLCLTRLQVVSKIVDLKSITRTLPKRPNQCFHDRMRDGVSPGSNAYISCGKTDGWLFFLFVYYESIKRKDGYCWSKAKKIVCLLWIDKAKANIKPIYECQCTGILQSKRFTRLAHLLSNCRRADAPNTQDYCLPLVWLEETVQGRVIFCIRPIPINATGFCCHFTHQY